MEYDYIIAGAGTAGCLLANRLSANPSVTVLLLEAGTRQHGLWVRMPAGVSRLIHPGAINWGYHTEPEPGLGGRRIYAPRGRGLGGSSLINGMAYFRGQPQDYDSWAAQGAPSWSWDQVEAAYRRLEHKPADHGVRTPDSSKPGTKREGGDRTMHANDGRVYVTAPRFQHPSSRDFLGAAESLGVTPVQDFNDGEPEGVGMIPFSIRRGERHHSAAAFLTPAASRANLKVITEAQVDRLHFEGKRCTGLTFLEGNGNRGQRRHVTARREVILAAGTFGSPAILLRSGVGPGADLQALNIPVVQDLPGVGHNLQDHLYIHHTFAVSRESSMNPELRGWRAIRHGLRYLLGKQGPLTMGASQACAFVRSGPDVDRADLQITYRPMSWRFEPDGSFAIGATPEVTVSVCNLRPSSRGHVSLSSPDPFAQPRIQANYFTAERDQEIGIRSIRRVREIFATEPLRQRIQGELMPGPDIDSDDQLLQYVRDTAQSMHHWAGTCAMGRGPQAVVDDALRVHGVEGLRVADAAVMPFITSANTNAPSFVIGQRLSELMQGES